MCIVAFTEVYASMLWIRASMPAAAVTFGGQLQVSTGSTSAMLGMR